MGKKKFEDMYVQTKLRSTENGDYMFCYINQPHRFVEGSVISLKGSDERWEVVRKYNHPYHKSELRQDWKVGGLS